ncbi:MAG: hypothetical protein AB8B97_21175 [Granulosicoccus sp.]
MGGRNSLRVAGLVSMGAAQSQLQCSLWLQKLTGLYGDLAYKSISVSSDARLSTPDSLPVISQVTGLENVIVDFGYQLWVLTHAASSARLVADILFRRQSVIDRDAYSTKRFIRVKFGPLTFVPTINHQVIRQ